jgi:Prophage minor tail protein Z (GPZ)
MAQTHVSVDISNALRKFNLVQEETRSAIPRALNKTATTVRARAARQIRSVGYGIKIAAIKKSITIRKANRAELTAIVRAAGKPIPLINYSARKNKSGVTVAVLNGKKTIDGAFIATMHTGHKGVFVRVGSAAERHAIGRGALKVSKGPKKYSYKHGLPIRELFGPSVPNAFANTIVQNALEEVVQQRFGVVLEQELRFVKLS